MNYLRLFIYTLAGFIMISSTVTSLSAQPVRPAWLDQSVIKLQNELPVKLDATQKQPLQRGLKQVGQFWTEQDGDAAVFEEFVRANFAANPQDRDDLFTRFEQLLEQIDGHMNEIGLALRWQVDLDLGPILPADEIFSAYDPGSHINDDFFKNKLAFVVLLNFPLTTLDQRLTEGKGWSRRQWAEARLAQRFSKRIPAEVNLAVAEASASSGLYISRYNIWMHHLINEKNERLFPAGMKLLSHWNLRDEIKAQYEKGKDALPQQRIIQQVMERIVTQSIPGTVIDNPFVDWNPFSNKVQRTSVNDSDSPMPAEVQIADEPEDTGRYATWLSTYKAARKADPYSPTAPTLIARRFDENREIPEARVKAILEQVVSSPLAAKVGKLIEKRLGRKLESFDIWYNGFKAKSNYTREQLDQITAQKYPNAQAFEDDIPNILTKLGFSREKADYLAANIAVDPARGSGHASGALLSSAKAHLRTRVGKNGMDYKGYNIAIHELGHNVEQTFSLKNIDHWLLQGVPNTAFTEAFAFVFQARDLELLGLAGNDPQGAALKTINDFWMTYEIAGVALVDMDAWRWMYEHPEATPARFKEAVLSIAKNIWNRYYAPVFKKKDVVLLAVYSHMVDSFLYLPDYPLGHLIAHQIEEQIARSGNLGSEMERMTVLGTIAPDLWMQQATGSVVGADALLHAAEKALQLIR
jgi:hypothetical protein